jgi:hypothetical protein
VFWFNENYFFFFLFLRKLCPSCTIPISFLPFEAMANLEKENGCYCHGIMCGECKAFIKNEFFWHCSSCLYDLCISCEKKNVILKDVFLKLLIMSAGEFYQENFQKLCPFFIYVTSFK